MLNMEVMTLKSELKSSYAFYIVPINCIKNQHAEFDFDTTILALKFTHLLWLYL